VLRTTCSACRHGHHDECQGGQKPPEGVMGGWECVCEHKPAGDRQRVIETSAHDRAAQRLMDSSGGARAALEALDPGFDLDDLRRYVWSGSPSLPERYVPLVTGMATALILLGYELGREAAGASTRTQP
jgi:hypothetical protein